MARARKNAGSTAPFHAAKRFDATLERMRSRLNWVVIRIPFDAAKVFGTRGQIKIKGTINGFPFGTSLFPTGESGHILLVNKRMQKGARAAPGSVARFEIEVDKEKREATIPEPLQRILAADRPFRRWYDQLNHSTRAEIARWVNEPQSAEARARRSDQIAERLLETMQAERELPPMLRLALARIPRARKGWDQMSKARRRSHLLAIFYYRTPQGRANRIEKMLDDAIAIAEKRQKGVD
ncbi:MAG: YdeI/OmpD-associated family protein [Terriglobales bacterium]